MGEICAVVTASSNSGSACIDELLFKYPGSARIRAVFRTQAKASTFLEARGLTDGSELDVVSGVDAKDKPSLKRAFEGASTALIVTPMDHAAGMQDDAMLTANMIEVAKACGVRHVVYVGSWTVHVPEQIKVISSRFVPTEKLLADDADGLQWTSLRSGFFYNNLVQMMGSSIKAADAIVLPEGICLPAVDPADIGRAAAAVISVGGQGHHGKHYEISGPARLTLPGFAQAFTKGLGRPIACAPKSVEGFCEALPPFLAELIRYLVDAGEDAVPLSRDVEMLTGTPAVSFESWLKANIESFR
ncbi:unnamed protein product [Discosporangium mesarthrocarpum]